MILFVIGQLFINYKRGMVISPFYHYGMYSEVIKPKPLYGVYEVRVNNELLQSTHFSPQKWDKIILPIKYFHSLDSMKSLYEKDVKRLMLSLGIHTDATKFTTRCDVATFSEAYKNYLQNVLDKPVDSVNITYRNYAYTGTELKPTQLVYSLEQLCN
ncbi:MAG TPA: hypothetical protein VF622_09040 [Segetibacter sp.]